MGDRQNGRAPRFPSSNQDIWAFFWDAIKEPSVCSFEAVWTKAHRNLDGLEGYELLLAKGNAAADAAAKAAAKNVRLSCTCYQALLRQVLERVKLRSRVDAFHLSLAFLTAGQKDLVFEAPAEC